MHKQSFFFSYFFNSLPHKTRLLTTLGEKPFEKIVGKGENAGNQHFLLFPQCFQPFQTPKIIILSTLILSSANAFNLDQSKILSSRKGLRAISSDFCANELINSIPNNKIWNQSKLKAFAKDK